MKRMLAAFGILAIIALGGLQQASAGNPLRHHQPTLPGNTLIHAAPIVPLGGDVSGQ